jgi:hypothetical protein
MSNTTPTQINTIVSTDAPSNINMSIKRVAAAEFTSRTIRLGITKAKQEAEEPNNKKE